MGKTEWQVVTGSGEVRLSIVRSKTNQVVAESHKFGTDDDLFYLATALMRAIEERKRVRKQRRKEA